jgi:hypothetical protein
MYNKIMETGTAPEKKEPKGNDLMKKHTSKIIRTIYIISSICMVVFGIAELYEIFIVRAASNPRRSIIEALFWSTFAVYHLCNWYIRKHRNEIGMY